MTLIFNPFTLEAQTQFETFSHLRPIYISEGQFLNQYLWSNYYATKYTVTERYFAFLMNISNAPATMMPYCKKEDLIDSFFEIKEYFNHVLDCPLKLYLSDQFCLDELMTSKQFQKNFCITKFRDGFDYMYDAEKLRTLSGRAYHKKKNLFNSFQKRYHGRYSYRTLDHSNIDEILFFYENWMTNRSETSREDALNGEHDGLLRLFQNLDQIPLSMAGVYIDNQLEAFTVGSYRSDIRCAFIHIEKANASIQGLYNYINQQFITHSFPDAQLVNREDDLGEDGLRKAKLSYNPIRLETKYHIFEI